MFSDYWNIATAFYLKNKTLKNLSFIVNFIIFKNRKFWTTLCY